MQIGDFVRLKNDTGDPDTWKVVEITDESIVVRHKNVGGLFTFSKDAVISVLNK